MLEEILLRLGVDGSTVAKGLRSVKQQINEFKDSVSESFKEAFKHLAAPLSVAGVLEGLHKTLEAVKQIKTGAEALGVSTDFYQDIRNVGKAVGVTGEQIESMFAKFEKGLPAGADVEEEFYRFADQLKNIEDPATRAQMAIERFGKSGIQMVKIAAQGGDALRQMASEFQKFSRTDIEALESAHQQFEKTGNTVQVFFGKLIGGASMAFQALGRMSVTGEKFDDAIKGVFGDEQSKAKAEDNDRKAAQARAKESSENADILAFKKAMDDMAIKSKQTSSEEKIAILERRKSEEQSAMAQGDSYAHALNIKNIENEIADIKDGDRKKAEEADKKRKKALDDIANTEADIADVIAKQQETRLSGYRPSLEELAKSHGPFSGTAQQIINNKQRAKQRFMAGDSEGANALVNQNEGYDEMVSEIISGNGGAGPLEGPRGGTAQDEWFRRHGISYGTGKLVPHHATGLLDRLRGTNGPLSPDMAAIESEKTLRKLHEKFFVEKAAININPKMTE